MSRTYVKAVKCGICTGSNTEYYKARRRKVRNMNNHMLRNLIANHNIDEVNDLIITISLPHNSWDEPTDGTFLVTKKDRNFYINDPYFGNRNDGTSLNYWNRKFGNKLKPKH